MVTARKCGGVRTSSNSPHDDSLDMAATARVRTYDDDLHDRRRLLALVREPLDLQEERLKRLVERVRDTRDP